MPHTFTRRAVLYSAVGTLASVVISIAVTAIALRANGLPLVPVALYLSGGLPAVIGPLVMFPLVVMMRRQRTLQVELERLVRTDSLTGLPNRRAFFEFARPVMARAVAGDTPLTALMIDVDHFKAINDSYGHDNGDLILKRIAATIADAIAAAGARQWIVARIGGEEFAAIIGGLVPGAIGRLAEQINTDVRALTHREIDGAATVSIGVAFRGPGMGIDRLLKAADDAAYAAKRAGRDRWSFATGEQPNRRPARPLPLPANDRIAV